jgi:hypothetical protein
MRTASTVTGESAPAAKAKLKRSMGLWMATALVVGNMTTLWEIPRAGHTGGISATPDEYERRVIGFFDHALHARR